jgi:hypothetical protein
MKENIGFKGELMFHIMRHFVYFIYTPGIWYGALRLRRACTYCMGGENMNAEF